MQRQTDNELSRPLLPIYDSRDDILRGESSIRAATTDSRDVMENMRLVGSNFGADDSELRLPKEFTAVGADVLEYMIEMLSPSDLQLIAILPKPGTKEWWQLEREGLVECAKALLEMENTQRKIYKKNLTREEFFYTSIKIIISNYDLYKVDPTPEEQQLRVDLAPLYDKYAQIVSAKKELEIQRHLASVKNSLESKRFDKAYNELRAAAKLLQQCEPKFVTIDAFKNAKVFDATLQQLAAICKAYAETAQQGPAKLANAIVAQALGREILYWADKSSLIAALTKQFSEMWLDLFVYLQPATNESKLLVDLLVQHLMQTLTCQTMVGTISVSLQDIDASKWACGGFYNRDTKQLIDRKATCANLTSILQDAPANTFDVPVDFLRYAITDPVVGVTSRSNSTLMYP